MELAHGFGCTHVPGMSVQLRCHGLYHLQPAKPCAMSGFQDYRTSKGQSILFLGFRCGIQKKWLLLKCRLPWCHVTPQKLKTFYLSYDSEIRSS